MTELFVPIRKMFGFTLIEMMITVSLVAILTGLAVPYVADFISTRNLTAQTSGVKSLFTKARMTAMTRPTRVVLCWNLTNVAIADFPAGTNITGIPMPPFSITSAIDGPIDELQDQYVFNAQQSLTIVDDSASDCVTYTPRGILAAAGSAFTMTFDGTDDRVVLSVPNSGRASSVLIAHGAPR